MERSVAVIIAVAARPGRYGIEPPSPAALSSGGAAPARPGGRWEWAAGGAGQGTLGVEFELRRRLRT